MNTTESSPLSINESDLHAHLQDRMAQRGITFAEMQQTLAAGWQATDF